MATLLTYLIVALFVLLWAYTAIPKFFKFRSFYPVVGSQAIPKWRLSLLSVMILLVELAVVFPLQQNLFQPMRSHVPSDGQDKTYKGQYLAHITRFSEHTDDAVPFIHITKVYAF